MQLTDSEKEEVVRVAVEAVLRLGWGCLKDPEKVLPFWKRTSLYERGVVIRRDTIRDCAPKWKVRDELRKLTSIGGKLPYDRDFFQGLADACCKVYSNGFYRRLEFCGHTYVRQFLEGGEHGQNVPFAALSSKRGVSRTLNLPLLEVPSQGNNETYLLGVVCGSRAVVGPTGEVMAEVKGACEEGLKAIGLVRDHSGGSILFSPFYVVLLLGELPEAVRAYWMEKLPSHGVHGTKHASLVAAIHWEKMFGRNARKFRDAFPFLLSAAHHWNVGVDRDFVVAEMRRRRFDHVASCISDRLNRWYNLQQLEHQPEQEDEHNEDAKGKTGKED